MDDAPVVKLINGILTDAVKRGASDIHFECFEHEIRVRYRIDGALQEVMKPPLKMKAALVSRFKIMSQLNIAERRVPQDGRIKLKMGNEGHRLPRVDAAHALRREDRAANSRQGQPDARPRQVRHRAARRADLMEAISNPYGMVLVTGPTGSGKTTTLYSALSADQHDRRQHHDGRGSRRVQPAAASTRCSVRNEIGMTFAAALKAFLRQDPNIIMVGEIRDLETGGIAIKAALTGHLVLSTLHTNDAPRPSTRLIDMGLEPFNVAQRGATSCSRSGWCGGSASKLQGARCTLHRRGAARAADGGHRVALTRDRLFFRGTGCDALQRHRATRGAQGLYEVMLMTPKLRADRAERGASTGGDARAGRRAKAC